MTSHYRRALTAKLHILLKEQGAEDQKEAIYSGYGVTSSKELSDDQLSDLVGKLDVKASAQPQPQPQRQQAEVPIKKLRSIALSLLTKPTDALNPRNRGFGIPNDWLYLNPFVQHYNHSSRLTELSADQIKAFTVQMRQMRDQGYRWDRQSNRLIKDKPEDLAQQDQDRYAAQQIFDFPMPSADGPVS